jgi:hypothetical protein
VASFATTGGGSAAGNSTRGIFTVGRNSSGAYPNPFFNTTRNKYTYACCTSTATGVGAASQASYNGSAAGNSTRGIFALGVNGCACQLNITIRNKYTYSTDTSTASGVASASSNTGGPGAGVSWATCVNT